MLQQKMPSIHPGEILKEIHLDPLGITITALANNLRGARKTVSQLINGHLWHAGSRVKTWPYYTEQKAHIVHGIYLSSTTRAHCTTNFLL